MDTQYKDGQLRHTFRTIMVETRASDAYGQPRHLSVATSELYASVPCVAILYYSWYLLDHHVSRYYIPARTAYIERNILHVTPPSSSQGLHEHATTVVTLEASCPTQRIRAFLALIKKQLLVIFACCKET